MSLHVARLLGYCAAQMAPWRTRRPARLRAAWGKFWAGARLGWDGVGALFERERQLRARRSKTAVRAPMTAVDDAKAIEGDWKSVGDDLKAAIADVHDAENSHKRVGDS